MVRIVISANTKHAFQEFFNGYKRKTGELKRRERSIVIQWVRIKHWDKRTASAWLHLLGAFCYSLGILSLRVSLSHSVREGDIQPGNPLKFL